MPCCYGARQANWARRSSDYGRAFTKNFLVAFALNLLWEFGHCQLYETCRRQSWKQNIPLLIKMSAKDGLFVILFYLAAFWTAGRTDITASPAATALYLTLALTFSFIDERISIKLRRWEYATAMPKVAGVGVTPLLEIAVTGWLAFIVVFNWL